MKRTDFQKLRASFSFEVRWTTVGWKLLATLEGHVMPRCSVYKELDDAILATLPTVHGYSNSIAYLKYFWKNWHVQFHVKENRILDGTCSVTVEMFKGTMLYMRTKFRYSYNTNVHATVQFYRYITSMTSPLPVYNQSVTIVNSMGKDVIRFTKETYFATGKSKIGSRRRKLFLVGRWKMINSHKPIEESVINYELVNSGWYVTRLCQSSDR